jgi:cell division protein FtsB
MEKENFPWRPADIYGGATGCICVGTQYVLSKEVIENTPAVIIEDNIDLRKKEVERLKKENDVLKQENKRLKGKSAQKNKPAVSN